MNDEMNKVYVCRDIVFNETEFGESDYGTVLELDRVLLSSCQTVN